MMKLPSLNAAGSRSAPGAAPAEAAREPRPAVKEETLWQTEERFRLLVESVKDYAIFMLDPEGHVASWNPGAERIKGYKEEQILGKHFSVFYPPEDQDKPARELTIAREEGRFEEEGWRVRRDGSRFWANVVISAVFGSDGILRGFAKVTRDFTDRRASEETARKLVAERAARDMAEASERKLSAILATVAEGISVQDETGRVLYANDAAARSCGFSSAEEMLRTSPADIVSRFVILDERGQPFPLDRLPGRLVLEGLAPPPTLLVVQEKATGQRWWSVVKATAIRDETGRPSLAVSVWHDLTQEQRAAEIALFLSEASRLLSSGLDYNITLQHVADATVPTLADWAAVDVLEDQAWCRVAVAHVDPDKIQWAHELHRRYPIESGAERGIPQVARTGRSELYTEITDEMLVMSAVDEEHLQVARSLGLRSAIIVPLVARGTPLGALSLFFAESGRRYTNKDLAVAEELGRRAGMAIDNARLYREAREALKLRDDFLLIAGHELKTPLAALTLQVAGVDRLVKRADRVDLVTLQERFEKMSGHCQRLGSLINELLDVSRITAGRLDLSRERLDLSALTSEIIERFHDDLLAAGCRVQFEGEPVAGEWDRLRVDQVVTNLLSNAVKYGRGKPIVVSVFRRDDCAILTVHDEGIGISLDDQARIFGRFERAVSVRNFGGLGLGLWISREIVEAHEGTISVQSAPGAGASFTVKLPC